MNDLVKNLRDLAAFAHADLSVADEAADRIEQLELALRWIAAMTPDPEFGAFPIESAIDVARAALEGKNE